MRLFTYIAGIIGVVIFWTGLVVCVERLEAFLRHQFGDRSSALWRVRRSLAGFIRGS
jgi:hypothetical protein